MGPAQRPLHLLFLDESSADHLVDRRLHECRANRFPLPSTLAEVQDELAVTADVCSKVIEAVDDLLRSVRTGLMIASPYWLGCLKPYSVPILPRMSL